MRITYVASLRGKKIYTVTLGPDRLFSGTLEEVKCFIEIHNEKIRQREMAVASLLSAMRAAS